MFLIFAFVAACSANPISKAFTLTWENEILMILRMRDWHVWIFVGRVYNEPGMNPDLFEGDILGIDPFNLKPGEQVRLSVRLWTYGLVKVFDLSILS